MAGIGFELKKIISENSLSSFLKASISGIFIVAGPWLLSVLSLSIISFISRGNTEVVIDEFFSILVYIFAFSLILSGGFQYLFTRIFSDYIYENKVNESLYIILIYMTLSGIIGFIIPFITSLVFSGFNYEHIDLILSCSLLSSVINMLWIILIFVSFLKWYKNILLSFLIGIIIIAILIVKYNNDSIIFLLNSYTLGNLITLIGLLLLSITKYRPVQTSLSDIFSLVKDYWVKYKYLFLTGVFYYLSLWIDKIFFWIYYGEKVGTFSLNLFYNYDYSVYLANLSIIPGMVYFIINSETSFFMSIKKFLLSLISSDYSTIYKLKLELKDSARKSLNDQFFFQSLLTTALSLLTYKILPNYYITLIITLWAVNFQLLTFSYMNYLFYMDMYKHSFIVVLLMMMVNIIFFYIFKFLLIGNIPGLSYLISTVFGYILGRKLFNYNLLRLDRYIYAQSCK